MNQMNQVQEIPRVLFNLHGQGYWQESINARTLAVSTLMAVGTCVIQQPHKALIAESIAKGQILIPGMSLYKDVNIDVGNCICIFKQCDPSFSCCLFAKV